MCHSNFLSRGQKDPSGRSVASTHFSATQKKSCIVCSLIYYLILFTEVLDLSKMLTYLILQIPATLYIYSTISQCVAILHIKT